MWYYYSTYIDPLTGSWVAEHSTWPWIFWSTSMLCGVVQLVGFILIFNLI
ncbi:hypothetical protein M422DRAFT_195969 [Sphaerobolus stellatus SS14]|uniref:Uncharacterized protein n=1 Tax=Sphaerobolus stellatus (strain SS14) TaxID=990650 RepID=A0A0C9UDC4_SPHS4|nr:hypothetical protein M422DRAFT_195969 [Sphaerobolus stellatus SS14]